MDTIQQLTERAIRNRYRSHLKQQLITTKDYKIIGQLTYKEYKYSKEGNFTSADFYSYLLTQIEHSTHPLYIQVARQLNRGRALKSKNIKERIYNMIMSSQQAYFITLTFDDNTLNITNTLTRRRYVTRALKSNAIYYLANIDFGSNNGREHYHAVTTQPLTQEQWPYGYVKSIQIGHRESEPVKIAKYITKLNNHALKRSTGGNTRFNPIIYSRTKGDTTK